MFRSPSPISNDKGLISHGGLLPHCSHSDSVMPRDMSGELVFLNPPWELAKDMARHFESYRRTSPMTTMAVVIF
jgi:hypothetical protein